MDLRVGDGFAPTSFTNRASDTDFEELLDGFNSVQDAYFDAARRGDLTKIEKFLKNSPTSGLNINAVDKNGNNALQIVAGANVRSYNAVRVIRNLIRAGVDLLHTNKAGDTASDIAHRSISQGHMFGREKADAVNDGDGVQFLPSVFQGTEERTIAFLEKQKSAGNKTYLLNLEVADDVTALMYAAGNDNADTVQAMVDALKDNPDKLKYLNKVGLGGHTALHAAMKDSRSYDILKKAGAKDDIENEDGDTPHELRERAIEKRGDPAWDKEQGFWWNMGNEMLIWLSGGLNDVPPGYGTHEYTPPATYSPAADDTSATRPPAADESLAQAIFDRDETRAVSLLAKGANAAAGFSRNISFLLCAAASGQNKLVKALLASLEKAGDLDDVLNAKGINGMTPLLAAAFDGNSKLVDLLLAKGADPTATDELLGITARNALIAARSEDDTTPLHDILKKRASANDAPYIPGGRGARRFGNWLFQQFASLQNDESTTTQNHPPVSSPPESGVEEDATSENEDTQGEDAADALEEADQADEQGGSGTSPISMTPPEIIAHIARLLDGPDRYQGLREAYSFARTNKRMYAIVTAIPEYKRRLDAVNAAQALWDSVFKDKKRPSYSDDTDISRIFDYLSKDQRSFFIDYIMYSSFNSGWFNYTAVGTIFPHLTRDDQAYIIDSAIEIRSPPVVRDLLLADAANFDQRPAENRDPQHEHEPNSYFSRIFDAILPSIGRNYLASDRLLPHIGQMDESQQMLLLMQAISVLEDTNARIDLDDSPARALRDLILNGTEEVRKGAIEELTELLHKGNTRRDEIAIALSAGFSDLSSADQDTITGIINSNPDLIPYVWASLGGFNRNQANEAASSEADFIKNIINRAKTINNSNEDKISSLRVFNNIGQALPGLNSDMQTEVISSFMSGYQAAFESDRSRAAEVLPQDYASTVSSIIENIESLNPALRSKFLESVVSMTAGQSFGPNIMELIVVLSRNDLHRLTEHEISMLENAAKKMKNGKNNALALLRVAKDQLKRDGQGQSNEPRDVSYEPVTDEPETLEEYTDDGYEVLEGEASYKHVMEDNDPDTVTLIDPEDDPNDGLVVINRYDASMDGTGRGDPNRQYVLRVDSAEVKELVGADLAFQKKLGKELDYHEVFRMRFLESDSLTPGMREAADRYLRTSVVAKEEKEAIQEDIADGGWSAGQLQGVLDSKVLVIDDWQKNLGGENGTGTYKGKLEEVVNAALYDGAADVKEENYENALNALAVWIKNHWEGDMSEGVEHVPAFDDNAKRYLRTIVTYLLQEFGNDKGVNEAYHYGDERLLDELPSIIATRVENAFADDGNKKGMRSDARDYILSILEGEKTNGKVPRNHTIMVDIAMEEYGNYVDWARMYKSGELDTSDDSRYRGAPS